MYDIYFITTPRDRPAHDPEDADAAEGLLLLLLLPIIIAYYYYAY